MLGPKPPVNTIVLSDSVVMSDARTYINEFTVCSVETNEPSGLYVVIYINLFLSPEEIQADHP